MDATMLFACPRSSEPALRAQVRKLSTAANEAGKREPVSVPHKGHPEPPHAIVVP